MASTYTTSLKIQQIGNGEQAGTWGSTTNTNWNLIEQAVAGVQTITMSNANYTLSNLNGTLDEARNAVLVVVGTNSNVYQVIAPLATKTFIVSNQTTGGYAITIGGASGSIVTVPNGVTTLVYCDGTNFYSGVTGLTGNQIISGNLSVSGTLGVTGAITGTTATFSGSISSASPAFTGTPTAPTAAAGTNTTQIATTAFVAANAVLTGALLMWPTASAPTGYLLCDGSAVSRTTYSALYAVIGTTFGTGDGSTTFNLPNYTNRMPIGTGSIAALAATGGSKDAVVVSHTHSISDPGHFHTIAPTASGTSQSGAGWDGPGFGGSNTSTSTTGISVNSAGSSGTNANLPPYLGINFIIKT